MKQHGILVKPFLVVAIVENRKWQTRRLMKPQPPEWCTSFGFTYFTPKGHVSGRGTYKDEGPAEKFFKIRYNVGDQLYIKEAHYAYGYWRKDGLTKTGKQKWRFVGDKSYGVKFMDDPPHRICTQKTEKGWYKRSALFMPRWAARYWLEVTKVRVERACDISEEDAVAEGIERDGPDGWRDYVRGPDWGYQDSNPVGSFQSLWHTINGESTWNHWCFAYDFKRIEKPK